MAQPYDRTADVPAVGELDRAAGQFWVGNPWQIVSQQHNLSAFERNRTFLNLGAARFADISFHSGMDSDGDGRSAFEADLDGNGMQDLVVRQAGGGPLRLFLNRFPPRHYLRVSLRGTRSNRLGVGARLTAQTGARKLVRELFPANTFASQAPCQVYFGLGDAARVDRLTIRWPSGRVQEVSDIAADQHIRVEEGGAATTIAPAEQTTETNPPSPSPDSPLPTPSAEPPKPGSP